MPVALPAAEPAGMLDPTFGQAGIQTYGFGQALVEPGTALAKAPDGRLYMLGRTQVGPPIKQGIAFMRMWPDGAKDLTFGSGGRRTYSDSLLGNLVIHDAAFQSNGRLVVAGHDVVADDRAAKRELAYVPDDPKLFDTLTVWEHLEFIAAAYRVPDFAPAAAALLEQFELVDKRDTLAQELSRGMRQKVAICCAYLHEPSLLMFDEPMTGLDPHGIRTLKESIREHARRGAGVLISSHLLALVEDLTTHLLILHRGRRLFSGSLAEARQSFASDVASLEEVFFRATEGAADPSVTPPLV